jgi:hypothetical protein
VRAIRIDRDLSIVWASPSLRGTIGSCLAEHGSVDEARSLIRSVIRAKTFGSTQRDPLTDALLVPIGHSVVIYLAGSSMLTG